MDLSSRETAWSNRALGLFDKDSSTVAGVASKDVEFHSLSFKILGLHKSLTKTWWNIKSLEEYKKANLVPRGLRIQIFPAWEATPEFQSTWEAGLAKCSTILLDMLIEHDQILLNKIKTEIKTCENKLGDFDKDILVSPFQLKLKNQIDIFEKEIISRKRNKFYRDKSDYTSGKAYRWSHRGNRRPLMGDSTGVSESQNGQEMSSSDFFIFRRQRHRRRNRRGRRRTRTKQKEGQGIQELVTDIQERDQIQQEEINDNRIHTTEADLYLFCRQLTFKLLYHQPSVLDTFSDNERQVFRDLLELLQENEGSPSQGNFTRRLPSQATPSFSLFPAVQIFFDKACRDIEKLKLDPHKYNNISKDENRALQNLKKNKEFVIREADKGGNVVLWPHKLYLKEITRQLSNGQCYTVLPADPTSFFKNQLEEIIYSALDNNTITKKEADFLITPTPVIPTFYALPKVHKSLVEPPGRPIVSGIGSIFERPCIYPLVTSLKSYTRDSTHLLQLIEDCVVPEDVLLISMDVEALYTSIAHSAGIHAVTYFLAKSTGGITEHDRFILSLLYFILDKNYFVFDRKFFRQLSGTAMGARCAPSYANLFLGWWEETTVFLHPLFGTMACTWQRYIDDILMIWTGSLEDCNQFINDLNTNNLNIRLTSVISTTSIDFLDLKLSVMDSKISCGLYRKTTATNISIHIICEKGSLRANFYVCEETAVRIPSLHIKQEICPTGFKQRGYPHKLISDSFPKSQKKLFDKKVRDSTRPLALITTYNNQWADVRNLLGRNWDILLSDKRILPIVSNSPCLVARRARNLRDDLCHSHYQRPTTRLNQGTRIFGSYPCGNCNICQFMISQDGYSVSTLPFQIRPKEYFNCKSRNLVYAIFCNCPKIYVGQTTQPLKRRMQQHLSNISTAARDREKNKTLSSVAAHFLDHHRCKVSSFKVMGLEGIHLNIRGGDIIHRLLRCETKWIFNLRSTAPLGLNEEILFTGFYKQL
ncbi:unnamed protein product [Ranitomeya imitator]|uniref:GIY-YIG domain-containing protein n=1 Tax=Ranitomeya imitator TaxID=111125 RepID=A0ABN9L888_9NEOB|nr:unnamed protein product [Ranitomeya imitator]